MKSQKVVELLNAYLAVLTDVAYLRGAGEGDPDLSPWAKDYESIFLVVKERGEPVLLVDAPEAGKHLLRCLAAGTLLVPEKPSFWTGGMSEHSVPRVFGHLWREIFDDSGSIRHSDRVYMAVRDLRQLLCCFKKMDEPCSEQAVDREVDSFVSVDRELPVPSPFWEKDAPEMTDGVLDGVVPFLWNGDIAERADVLGMPSAEVTVFLKLLDEVSFKLWQALGRYDWHEWSFGHGPGRVADLKAGSYKYDFPSWSERLDSAFAYDEAAFNTPSAWARAALSGQLASSEEVPSRLRAVPKDMTKPRLIAFESCANMWCQQNLLDYFSTRVRATWIGRYVSFDDQTRNQRLALKGSVSGTLATVDLSAASDRVTCTLVASWCRSNPTLLCALRACRTRYCDLGRGGEPLPLNKYATMGNATTFPVQSLIFLSIALASVAQQRGMTACEVIDGCEDEVAVFGDDIVIPVDCRSSFENNMNLLWFKLNADKTFWTSKFRESCGVDAYEGWDVTPAYVRSFSNETPDDVASLVAQSNNFYSKYLLRSAEFLVSKIGRVIPTRSASSGAFGLACRTGSDLSAFKKRWNHFLQRDEVKVPVLLVKQDVTPTNSDSSLLQYFTECPDPLSQWSAGRRERPVTKLVMGWSATQDY